MYDSTVPINNNVITKVGSKRHKNSCIYGLHTLPPLSNDLITSDSESILYKKNIKQVKTSLFNKVQPHLNYYLNINTPPTQYRY
jgi:hypothetical protein